MEILMRDRLLACLLIAVYESDKGRGDRRGAPAARDFQ
jgi:hypothetical protein